MRTDAPRVGCEVQASEWHDYEEVVGLYARFEVLDNVRVRSGSEQPALVERLCSVLIA